MHILNITFILNNVGHARFLPILNQHLQGLPEAATYSVQGAGNPAGQIFCVQFPAPTTNELAALQAPAATLQSAITAHFGQGVLIVTTTLSRL